MNTIDVEVLATCLQFAAASRDRFVQLLQFRLVNRRWGRAVGTTFQRWIEATYTRATECRREFIRFLPPTEYWSPAKRCDFRAVVLCQSDFSEEFFFSLTGISIPDCTDAELDWVSKHCPNVTHLELRCTKLKLPSLESLSSIGERFPRLVAISTGYDARLTELEVGALLFGSTRWSHLRLTQGKACTDTLLKSLRERRVQLTVFEIPGFPLLKQRTLVEFIESQPLLEKVDLSSIKRMGNRTLAAIGRTCHQLQFLDVNWCPRCKGIGMRKVAAGCRNLTVLRCFGIADLGNGTLGTLSNNCSSLMVLTLYRFSISPEDIDSIRSFNSIKCIDICFVTLISSPTRALWDAVSCMPLLETLSVTSVDIPDSSLDAIAVGCGGSLKDIRFRKVGGFSEAGAIRFIGRCPNLDRLTLAEGSVIGDAFMACLAQLGCKLASVDLEEQTAITAEGFVTFFRSPAAKFLKAFSCQRTAADDSVLLAISESECAANLTRLNAGKTFITDDGMMMLMDRSPSLSSLDLCVDRFQFRTGPRFGGKGITDAFINYLISHQGSCNVTYLNLFGCQGVSVHVFAALVRAYPGLLFNSDFEGVKQPEPLDVRPPLPEPSIGNLLDSDASDKDVKPMQSPPPASNLPSRSTATPTQSSSGCSTS
jgi:hypothetical protein